MLMTVVPGEAGEMGELSGVRNSTEEMVGGDGTVTVRALLGLSSVAAALDELVVLAARMACSSSASAGLS